MRQEKVRRLASSVLRCGLNSVWLDPKQGEKISSVMTKEDVRALVQEGVIKKRLVNSQSRGRARALKGKRQKGRKRGKGKRKGTKKARVEKKRRWIGSVRSQRKMLKKLRKESPKAVEKAGYRSLYKRVKGGYFKGKKYLEAAVKGKKE